MSYAYSDDVPRPRRPGRPGTPFGTLLLAIVVGVTLGILLLEWVGPWLAGRFRGPANDPAAKEREAVPRTGLDPDETEAIDLFKNTRDSVVNVDTLVLVRNRLDLQVQQQQAGTGSGFVWDTDGRVVTNFHVVRQAVQNNLSLRVVMADRTTYQARVVGTAPDWDLAVLQIPAPKDKLRPIKLGTSGDLQVGQKAFAIGNPFGLSLTLTKGIVSALDREIESSTDHTIPGAIQIDAPINPGNSGGPLLDKDGRLIGVNTSIVGPSGGNVGIGFAIPVDTVNPVVTELIQRGRVQQPDLGLKLVDQRRVRRAGFATGVMVGSVDPNGPAAAAGLRGLGRDPETGEVQAGDRIVAVNGRSVRGTDEFNAAVGRAKVGEVLKLTVERDEGRVEVGVTVRGV